MAHIHLSRGTETAPFHEDTIGHSWKCARAVPKSSLKQWRFSQAFIQSLHRFNSDQFVLISSTIMLLKYHLLNYLIFTNIN